MEWFSAENIVAVLTAVLGVLASAGVLWYERRVPRRKRIGYRIQMDTPIGSDVSRGRANVRLGLFNETPDMADATLVLLRVENDGSQSIADTDYTARDEQPPLTVETDCTGSPSTAPPRPWRPSPKAGTRSARSSTPTPTACRPATRSPPDS